MHGDPRRGARAGDGDRLVRVGLPVRGRGRPGRRRRPVRAARRRGRARARRHDRRRDAAARAPARRAGVDPRQAGRCAPPQHAQHGVRVGVGRARRRRDRARRVDRRSRRLPLLAERDRQRRDGGSRLAARARRRAHRRRRRRARRASRAGSSSCSAAGSKAGSTAPRAGRPSVHSLALAASPDTHVNRCQRVWTFSSRVLSVGPGSRRRRRPTTSPGTRSSVSCQRTKLGEGQQCGSSRPRASLCGRRRWSRWPVWSLRKRVPLAPTSRTHITARSSGNFGSIKVTPSGGSGAHSTNFSFENMLPGEPQTATVQFQNTGANSEDVWLVFDNATALSALTTSARTVRCTSPTAARCSTART